MKKRRNYYGVGAVLTNSKNTFVVYIRKKIEMLEKEFKIDLTWREKEHFYSLKTEGLVDAYARKLLSEKL